MANVFYASGAWVSAGGDPPLAAGNSHYWISWGFDYGDVVSISAHGVTAGDPVMLAVEGLTLEHDVSGQRAYFSVHNVGSIYTRGYAIAYSFIRA